MPLVKKQTTSLTSLGLLPILHSKIIFSESRRLAYLPNPIVMCCETNTLGVHKNNPWDIKHMPVAIFFAGLDLEQISADFENPYF